MNTLFSHPFLHVRLEFIPDMPAYRLLLTLIRPVFLLFILSVSGCGSVALEDRPETVPAGGKLLYDDGSPVADAFVQFQAVNPPINGSVSSATGATDERGEFRLEVVLRDGTKVVGAPPGPHQATVIGKQGQDQQVEPVTLSEIFTVKSDADNHFTLRIKKPGGKKAK